MTSMIHLTRSDFISQVTERMRTIEFINSVMKAQGEHPDYEKILSQYNFPKMHTVSSFLNAERRIKEISMVVMFADRLSDISELYSDTKMIRLSFEDAAILESIFILDEIEGFDYSKEIKKLNEQ